MNENQDTITTWWEQKRILYNLIIILMLAYELVTHSSKPPLLSMASNQFIEYSDLHRTLWILLIANLPYCIGTGLENTIRFSNNDYNKYHSWFLFVTGLFVSWVFIKMNY